jgi:hypothetical protein
MKARFDEAYLITYGILVMRMQEYLKETRIYDGAKLVTNLLTPYNVRKEK